MSIALLIVVSSRTLSYRTLGQIAKLHIFDATGKGANKPSLWNELQAKGWDIQSRLYLGFGSQRVQWSIVKESPDKKTI